MFARKRRAALVIGIMLAGSVVFAVLRIVQTNPSLLPEENGMAESDSPAENEMSSMVFEAGVPFELVGKPMPETGPFSGGDYFEGGKYLFDSSWDWNGTMQLTVSSPALYNSMEEAGLSKENVSLSDGLYEGCRVIVVDIYVNNIDAESKKEVREYVGSSAFNTSMFHLESSFSAPGQYADATLISALPIEETTISESERARSYTWVDPGEEIRVRMGYYVTHAEVEDAAGTQTEQIDDTWFNPDYYLVLDAGGWREGAPVVKLGKAVPARGGETL